MDVESYLLWSPQGWGVFNKCTCPDPGAFPNYWYKKYVFPEEKHDIVFRKLLSVKGELERKQIIPSREDYDKIFSDIEDLLD